MSRHIWHTQALAIMASAAISHTGWHPAMVQFVARAGMQLPTGMWLHIWHSQTVADIQLLPRAGMWRHIGICLHVSHRLACSGCPICAQRLRSCRLACAGISGILEHSLPSSFCPELACGSILASAAISQIGWHPAVVQFVPRAGM